MLCWKPSMESMEHGLQCYWLRRQKRTNDLKFLKEVGRLLDLWLSKKNSNFRDFNSFLSTKSIDNNILLWWWLVMTIITTNIYWTLIKPSTVKDVRTENHQNLKTAIWGKFYYSHFTDEKSGKEKLNVTCLLTQIGRNRARNWAAQLQNPHS